MTVDYKVLLAKYMWLVGDREGTKFVHCFYAGAYLGGASITAEEVRALEAVVDDIDELMEGTPTP